LVGKSIFSATDQGTNRMMIERYGFAVESFTLSPETSAWFALIGSMKALWSSSRIYSARGGDREGIVKGAVLELFMGMSPQARRAAISAWFPLLGDEAAPLMADLAAQLNADERCSVIADLASLLTAEERKEFAAGLVRQQPADMRHDLVKLLAAAVVRPAAR
jgi:hypothetical protein